jgi:shikimate kinase
MLSGSSGHPIDGHVYLTGFMGAGKTTVGQLVAIQLERQFHDSDALIMARAKQTIPEIFTDVGEDGFRDIETLVLEELAGSNPAVIALGGGAILRSYNRRLLQRSGISVYLQWSPEQLFDRIFEDNNRPLVSSRKQNVRRTELSKLYKSRAGLYEKADLTVPCLPGMTPDDISTTILQIIGRPSR